MAITYPPAHYEQAVALGSTYDAIRDVWWVINGTHPVAANSSTAWECVEVWDGTTREAPAGGVMSSLSSGNLWKPGVSVTSLPQGAWATFRNPGGAVAARFQVFVKMEASSQASHSLISLDDWVIGGGTDAIPTLPATIIGQPPAGDGDGRFTDEATFIWALILDEGMLAIRMIDPAGGDSNDNRWTYMGEVDPVNTELDDPRPFITPRNTSQPWNGSFSHMKLSPVDQSTICNVRNRPYYNAGMGSATRYNDLGVEYLCNVCLDASTPAGHLHTVGYARNVGAIDQEVVHNRGTAGYTGSDYRFEVTRITATAHPQLVTLWPPGTALGAGHTIITEESVPTQLIPASGGGGTDPPVVVYVDPIAGSQIVPTTTLTIDVTDDVGGFANIQLRVRYEAADPLIPTETIYGGDDLGKFESLYTSSTIAVISNGFRFVLTRDGGWPSTPTFIASPIDSSGNTT